MHSELFNQVFTSEKTLNHNQTVNKDIVQKVQGSECQKMTNISWYMASNPWIAAGICDGTKCLIGNKLFTTCAMNHHNNKHITLDS